MRGFFVALLAFAASWLAGLLPATAPAEQKFAAPPSLVLITLDTTRNDAIGPAPGRPSRTPVLDRLAADGVRFQEAIAPTPLTLPSHASLLTGLDPPEHGLRDNGSFALPRELPTLATVLSERGYETAAFVATRVLDRRFGLARGFDTYDDRMVAERTGEYGYPERDAAAVTSAALAWLTERSLERPYFVWVHYYDPHAPYAAPGSDPRRSAKERYRDEIAFVDRQIGRLLASAPGAPADRVVAVVGDHGEALGEHGERTHGIFVYRATMVVPLILSGAGVPTGREVGETVAARRLAPTLLRLLAAPGAGRRSAPGTAVPGTALPGTVLPGLDLGDPPPEAAYSESQMPARTYGWSGLTALSDGDHRLIRAPRPELYEIVSDPDEQNNLVREQRALAGQLRDRLLGLEAGFTTHQPLPLAADGQLDAELRSLGYLGGAGETTSGLDPKDGIGLLNELEQANRLLASGQAAAAVRKLEALNAKSPDNVPFLTRLASAQEQAGEIDQAIATFERAISLDPDLEFLHHHLGRTLLNAKRYEAAEAAFEAALEIDPRFSQAWLSLAELALHRGRPADERKVLERAAAREVDSVAVLVRLAQILLAAKELGAERHLARACELLPELPLPWLLRGQAALIEGRREAARSHLERAIQAAPRSSIAGQARALLAQLGR